MADEASERFDEACEHARQRPNHPGLVLGPSLEVPMSQLRAGRLAWSREVRGKSGTATLYYCLDPAPSGKDGADLPIVGLKPGDVRVDLRLAPGSPERLLGVAPAATAPAGLDSFVAAVFNELLADAE